MFDAALRQVIDRPLDRVGARLAAAGVAPNQVTLVGAAVGVAAVAALAFQAYGVALALILLNRLMDGLDGAIARARGVTDFGGYLDIVADFVFYAAVIFGFALGRPEAALPAAFLIFSFVGTGTSFLAFAILAAKRGIETDRYGRKSLFYIGGFTEGSETIACFVAICLVPDAFAWIAWGFGALCWLTTGARVLQAHYVFGGGDGR